jgi:N,N'-diacetyllegionaminate synthase
MTTLDEVRDAVAALTGAGLAAGDVTLLHCNTQYPTPISDANLRAMETLAREFPDCAVGYSDHTPGITCPVAAAAMGATVIEKHFTLDKTMEGPDHAASLDPVELTAMVAGVREVELALGDGVKRPSASERENIAVARRFLVAVTAIKAGEPFTETNVTARRTGCGGVSPMRWDEVMGTPARKDFDAGEAIEL